MDWTQPTDDRGTLERDLLRLQPTTAIFESHYVRDQWVAAARIAIGYGATREEACGACLDMVRWKMRRGDDDGSAPPYDGYHPVFDDPVVFMPEGKHPTADEIVRWEIESKAAREQDFRRVR